MAKCTRKGRGRAGESTVSELRLSHDEIALRAYEVYLARGAAPGRDLEDWLQAERELRSSMKGRSIDSSTGRER